MANPAGDRSNGTNRSQILVLGLDLGTTSFKIGHLAVDEQLDSPNALALAQKQNPAIKVLENFPGRGQHSSTFAPVCLYYRWKAKLYRWGFQAEDLKNDDRFDPDLFVTNWKIALHESSDPTAFRIRRRLQSKANALGKSGLDDFAEDFAQALAGFLFEDPEESPIIKAYYGGIETFSRIDVVIAVPPGWPRHEHELLSTAIARGLGEKRNYRIFRASETECVLKSWMQDPNIRAKDGETLILADLGGGTACISAFKSEVAQEEELTWTHMESHSLSAGSELVSEAFEKDFKQRLVGIPDIKITSRSIHKAREKFDKLKVTIGEKNARRVLYIRVRGLKRDSKKEFLENEMVFSNERLLSYFQPSQDQIVQRIIAVTNRITKDHGTPPKYCLTAGAYANNVLFRRKLSASNYHNMIISLIPNNADAVARGACLTRIHGNFSQFAGGASKHSIGILTYIEESKAKKIYDFAARRTFRHDQTKYSPAILWTIRKGDPIKNDHVVEEGGSCLRRRTFEEGEDIDFTDTLFISDSEIRQEDQYTVLRFSTTDPYSWQQNMKNLGYRGITGSLYEVTWVMEKAFLKNSDLTPAGFCSHDNIGIDSSDSRRHKRKVLRYKILIHVSSTDIKVAFQTSHPGGRTGYLIADQKKIDMTEKGEFESTALQKEYENIGVGEEESQAQPELSGGRQISQQLPKTPTRTDQSSPPSYNRESSTPNSCTTETVLSEVVPALLSPISEPHGAVSVERDPPGGEPKRLKRAEYTQTPHSTHASQENPGRTEELQAPSPITERLSRISSRLRTRSCTPVAVISDPTQQSIDKALLLKFQAPFISPRATRITGEPQSSLRTPVVPVKKRTYEIFSDDDDVDDGDDVIEDDDKDDDWVP